MQIKNRLFAVLLVILLTGANLAMFKILDFLDNGKPKLQVPLPKVVNWKLRFDLKTFVKKEVYTILFQDKNDEFLDQFRTVIRDRIERNSTKRALHIDLEQDIIAYSIDRNNATFQVIVFQTTNARLFNAHIEDYTGRNQLGIAERNCALFLTQRSGKRMSKNELKKVAVDLLHSPKTTFVYNSNTQHDLLELHINNIHHTVRFQKMNLTIAEKGQELLLNGTIEYPTNIGSGMKYGLKSKGIYIYSRFIPKSLPDTLLSFLPDNLPHFKDIQSFAIDYQGMHLEDPIDNLPYYVGHLLVPKMNLIIQTKAPVNILDLWNEFPENVRRENNCLQLGSVIYKLKQLDKFTYFIGVDTKAITTGNSNEIFSVRGNISKTTKVYGGTFITAIIENMGPMKAINGFFGSTESFYIQLNPKIKKTYTIEGKFVFKPNKYPINELTKLVVNSPFVLN